MAVNPQNPGIQMGRASLEMQRNCLAPARETGGRRKKLAQGTIFEPQTGRLRHAFQVRLSHPEQRHLFRPHQYVERLEAGQRAKHLHLASRAVGLHHEHEIGERRPVC